MTNSLRKLKKSYSENTEFSCWLFPYPLSVQGTTIGIQQTFLGITSISLSAVSLYCTVNAFFFAKLTENFFYMIKTKTLRASKRLTLHSSDWFAFWRLLFNRRFLKFLISRKVSYPSPLEMRKLMCIPLHHIIWFQNPLNWRLPGLSLLLCLENIESVCMMWKILPVNLFWWGSQLLGATWQVASRVLP